MGVYQRTRQPGIFKYEGKNGSIYGVDYYADGKRHRELVGPVFEDARTELQKMRDTIKKGKYSRIINQRTKTFDDLLSEYSKQMEGTSFYRRMIQYFKPVILNQFGGKLLSEIDYKALEDFREWRKNLPIRTKYQARPRSKRTIDIEMAVLRRMFRKAVKWGWVMDDPFQNAEDLFYGKTGKRERALTPDEVRRLIEASTPHFKPILLTAIP
jgi:integrase